MRQGSFRNKDKVVFDHNDQRYVGIVKKVNVRTRTCIVRTPKSDYKVRFEAMFHLDVTKVLKGS